MASYIVPAFFFLALIICVVSALPAVSTRKQLIFANLGQSARTMRPSLSTEKNLNATELLYKQHIDHFTPDHRTFAQRYWYTDYYYKPGGPVFLMIHGEYEGSGVWIEYENLPLAKMARDNNAMVFLLEHRFYGYSFPFSDLSTENLKYLSAQQALADVAEFIQAMNVKHNVAGAKWITFGGSYGGMLAAWSRLKDPTHVYGAVSSSGPAVVTVDYYGYLEVVQKAITETSRTCAYNLKRGMRQIRELIRTPSGRAELKTVFKLCDSLDNASEDDITTFYFSILVNYMLITQYNRINAGEFRYNLTLEKICSFHEDCSVDPVQQMGNVNSYVMPYFGETCVDFNYDEGIRSMKNISNNSPYAEDRAWIWQTCTEFGLYQTTDSPTAGRFFGNVISLRYSTQQCAQIYGPQYTEASIFEAVKATNKLYGGRHYNGTRVVFVNGSWDPWHLLGILKSKCDAYTAVYMKGTAHCADMYESLPDDLCSLKIGQERIELEVAGWVFK